MAFVTKTETELQTFEQSRGIQPIRKISFTLKSSENAVAERQQSTLFANKGYTIKKAQEGASLMAYYQGLIFYILFVGYAIYTYVRKMFSYAAPTLIGLGMLSQNHMGIVNSSQYLAYAISKFLGGILSDKISGKLLFPIGLFISGFTTIAVGSSLDSNLWPFLWFVNGLGQGCGWPACSKLLKKWFSKNQFGTCWSILSTSSNLSGALGPLVSAYSFLYLGWRVSFIFSGVLAIAVGVISLISLRESPLELNLNPPCLEDEAPSSHQNGEELKAQQNWNEESYFHLLESPLLWIVSISYFIVFGTKTVLSDWGQVFLMNHLQHTQVQASTFNSALEAGGFIGGVLAGVLTDKYSKKIGIEGNCRLLISCLFMGVGVFSLHVLTFMTSPQTSQVIISVTGLMLGAALFGPITIFGIVASESFPASISGASHAVVALAANIGAIGAGWPFSKLSLIYGWKTCFSFCEILIVFAISAILFTRKFHHVTRVKAN